MIIIITNILFSWFSLSDYGDYDDYTDFDDHNHYGKCDNFDNYDDNSITCTTCFIAAAKCLNSNAYAQSFQRSVWTSPTGILLWLILGGTDVAYRSGGPFPVELLFSWSILEGAPPLVLLNLFTVT